MDEPVLNAVCPHCGALNRLPAARAGQAPNCGRCKAALLPCEPLPLTDAGFERYIAASGQPVLVDFWAAWCGPCRSFAPHYAQAAVARPAVRFMKVDVDNAPASAARAGIRSVPSLLLYRGGRELARVSGALPAAELLSWLDYQLVQAGARA